MDIVLHPVGWIHSSEHISKPGSREDYWGDVVSEIRPDESKFTSDELGGLPEFSHVEVFFYLHGVSESAVGSGRRHRNDNTKWPQVGIFALKLSRQ